MLRIPSGIVAEPDRAHVRLSELIAALSLGIDLGFGQPMQDVQRQCLMGDGGCTTGLFARCWLAPRRRENMFGRLMRWRAVARLRSQSNRRGCGQPDAQSSRSGPPLAASRTSPYR